MDRLSPYMQAKLCEAISALLEEEREASRPRLSNFAHCLFLLDLYKKEIPSHLLNELHAIMDDYVTIGEDGQITFRSNEFVTEEKAELAERLLSLYIDIMGGNLVL
jgi:hypothetical protein